MMRLYCLTLVLVLGCDLEDDVLIVETTTSAQTDSADSTGSGGGSWDTAETEINQECLLPGCSFSCDGIETCNQTCVQGGCTTECIGVDTCNISCDGPACTSVCTDTKTCRMSCPSGGCTLDCSGADTCEIVDCGSSCIVDCGGAPNCAVSCEVGSGCIAD